MESEKRRLRKSVYYSIGVSLFLWFIKALELSSVQDFGSYGILPRTFEGATGILFSGFIHGDIFHLMSNTVPLVLLGGAIIYFYEDKSFQIILFLYLLTGCMVWTFARPGYHIGASGLVYGMFSFMFFSGIFRRDRQTLAISLVTLVLYGGSMFSGLIPGDQRISWESHLIGFLLGLTFSIYYRKIPLSQANKPNYDENEPVFLDQSEEFCNVTVVSGQRPIRFKYEYKKKATRIP